MFHYEIVAYAVDGVLYCADFHTPEDTSSPVFAGDEEWQEHCCYACLAEAVAAGIPCQTLGEVNS